MQRGVKPKKVVPLFSLDRVPPAHETVSAGAAVPPLRCAQVHVPSLHVCSLGWRLMSWLGVLCISGSQLGVCGVHSGGPQPHPLPPPPTKFLSFLHR